MRLGRHEVSLIGPATVKGCYGSSGRRQLRAAVGQNSTYGGKRYFRHLDFCAVRVGCCSSDVPPHAARRQTTASDCAAALRRSGGCHASLQFKICEKQEGSATSVARHLLPLTSEPF
jgi:hypothetical protein